MWGREAELSLIWEGVSLEEQAPHKESTIPEVLAAGERRVGTGVENCLEPILSFFLGAGGNDSSGHPHTFLSFPQLSFCPIILILLSLFVFHHSSFCVTELPYQKQLVFQWSRSLCGADMCRSFESSPQPHEASDCAHFTDEDAEAQDRVSHLSRITWIT